MDRYSARMNLRGSTQRERELNRLKSDIVRKAPSSLSYKDVKLNGEPTQLMINTSTKPYYKEFQSLPDQRILAGDYVEWADSMWLVLNADCDDEVYTDGNLRQCQHRIYWQKADGTIVSRFAYTENASAYNNGETGNNTITLESNQFMVYIPYDKETAELDNGKRINELLQETGLPNVSDIDDIDLNDKHICNYKCFRNKEKLLEEILYE